MRPHIYGHIVTCRTRGCGNDSLTIRLTEWDGSPIWCGACSRPINAEPTVWHVPPSPEELGIEPAPQRAAELIAQMSTEERAALIALLGGPNEGETQ